MHTSLMVSHRGEPHQVAARLAAMARERGIEATLAHDRMIVSL